MGGTAVTSTSASTETPSSSKADVAYQAIVAGIQAQRYEPGDRLVLAQIATELDMSVVPVREAIRRLQSENLVAYERNVGATVVGIDPVEYQTTMETLALVEGFSTAQCAPLVTATDLETARRINDEMRAQVDGREEFDPPVFTQLNKEFHSVLFEHHQNAHIHDLVHRGWNRLSALRSSTFAYVPGRAEESVAEHEQLLDLIAAGAAFADIEQAARQHRLNTLNAYLSHTDHPDVADHTDRTEPTTERTAS